MVCDAPVSLCRVHGGDLAVSERPDTKVQLLGYPMLLPEGEPEMGVLDLHLSLGLVHRLGLNHFPRVYAEEEVVSPPQGLDQYPLPRCIGSPLPPESGWDRIKELFDREKEQGYPEELLNIMKGAITGLIVGFVYGGVPASRHARNRFIEQSQAELFRHRVEAVRAAQNAALRGFIRYGWRWGWRVATFGTIFNVVHTGLSVYRDKNSLGHFAAAGAVTGGLFRINLGLRGLAGGSAIGLMLGVPVGALMTAVQIAAGETLRERKWRERRELYERKLEEWAARLDVTHGAFEEVSSTGPEEVSSTGPEVSFESNAQRIDELLNRPRNPDPHQP